MSPDTTGMPCAPDERVWLPPEPAPLPYLGGPFLLTSGLLTVPDAHRIDDYEGRPALTMCGLLIRDGKVTAAAAVERPAGWCRICWPPPPPPLQAPAPLSPPAVDPDERRSGELGFDRLVCGCPSGSTGPAAHADGCWYAGAELLAGEAFMEATCTGRSALVTALTALNEAGYLTDPDDYLGLVGVLDRLVEDDVLRRPPDKTTGDSDG